MEFLFECLTSWSSPGVDRAKLHNDVDLFGNARITSDRSEIPAVVCKHSKPITWRVLAPNYQTWPREPDPKITCVIEMIFDDGSEHGGISSDEESLLDRKLENPSEESR